MITHLSLETLALSRFGGDGYILTRPVIYDLIYRQIPKGRIHLGTKILSTDQDRHGVTVKCIDGLEYKGDILVGGNCLLHSFHSSLFEGRGTIVKSLVYFVAR